MKLPVGTKVKIKTKFGKQISLQDSIVYRNTQKINQQYAYISRIAANYYVLSEIPFGPGDYYHECDVEPYLTYQRKEKLKKLNSL